MFAYSPKIAPALLLFLLSPIFGSFRLGKLSAQAGPNNTAAAQTEQLSPVVAEQRKASWLLLEEGRNLYREGNYDEALRKFLLLRRSLAYAPEADYFIGRIFYTDNNADLAIFQIKKALDQKDFLYDPNDIYSFYLSLAGLYYHKKDYNQYEANLLKAISLELPTDPEMLRKGTQIRKMLQNQGIDDVLYYYDDSYSHIVPALNELALFYYSRAYYNDALRWGLYSVISTLAQGIAWLKQQQYIARIPQIARDLYSSAPEYVIDKLIADLKNAGLDYPIQWNLQDLSLANPEEQIPQIISRIREVDPLYRFSLLGYYLNILEQYSATQNLLIENRLYRQLYFLATSLSIQGYMESANDILNVLNYLSHTGEWHDRAKSQLRQAFIDKQVPLGTYLPE